MMDSLVHSLNYMLPQGLHFSNVNIQKILQNSHNRSIKNDITEINATTQLSPASATSWTTSTIPSIEEQQTQMVNASALHRFTNSIANEFLRKLGATVLNSIQLQNSQQEKPDSQPYKGKFGTNLTKIATASASTTASLLNINYSPQLQQQLPQQLEQQQQQYYLIPQQQQQQIEHNLNNLSSINMNFMDNNQYPYHHQQNHVSIDANNYSAMDELQKQLEYDKFMNEVWIGVVLTLIFISMIFCFCSCFLYHQFIMWKRNYRSTIVQSRQSLCDTDESLKVNSEFNDPVPEYTLVSGLPSYEAALELLRKTKQGCLVMHPSVISIFEFEKLNNEHNAEKRNSQLDNTNLESIKIDQNYCGNNNNNYNSKCNKSTNNSINNDVEVPLLNEQLTFNTNELQGDKDASNTLSNCTTLTYVNEQYHNQCNSSNNDP